jgi:hypothetical protein
VISQEYDHNYYDEHGNINKRNYCYWESIIMLRKLAVVAMLIFLEKAGLTMQLLVVLGIMVVAMVAQVSMPRDDLCFAVDL